MTKIDTLKGISTTYSHYTKYGQVIYKGIEL